MLLQTTYLRLAANGSFFPDHHLPLAERQTMAVPLGQGSGRFPSSGGAPCRGSAPSRINIILVGPFTMALPMGGGSTTCDERWTWCDNMRYYAILLRM